MDNRIGGIDAKRRPYHNETDKLGFDKRLVKNKNGHDKHAARRDILHETKGGQGDAPGTQIEKKQGQRSHNGSAHQQERNLNSCV